MRQRLLRSMPYTPGPTNLLLAIVMCFPALAGCGLPALVIGRFEPPEVILAASKVETVSPEACDLLFTLAVRNPNPYQLSTHAVRYRLTVNGAVVAAGTSQVAAALPPNASGSLDVPVVVPLQELEAAAPGGLTVGEIPYQLEAWVELGWWPWRHEVHMTAASALRFNLPLGLARANRSSARSKRSHGI